MSSTIVRFSNPQTGMQGTADLAQVEAKTAEAATLLQPQTPQPENPAANVDLAFRKYGEERRSQQDLQGVLLQSNLQKQAGTGSKTPAQKTNSTTKTAGPQIEHAKVAKWQRGYLYDFGRPVSREQAAQWIFEDGKVPDQAKLVEGPNNTWHVQMPQDLKGQIEVVKKMKHNILENSHEQANTKEITWVDGPPLPAVVNQRRDLNNNLGFKVKSHYNLDPGQYTTEQLGDLGGKGHGHELQFDKPMTREQVMQTLYDKNNLPDKRDVKLEPVGNEPAQTWQVKTMGTGVTRLKSAVVAAFGDANTSTPTSAPPGVPASIRTHLENQTVPANAIAHPKGEKHPPGAYVWEQDGHLVYVVTDGKGKNGLYQYEVMKLSSNNQQYNKDMRYYMKENGMPPRMALAAFTKQWDELDRMILGGFAMALASGRMPGKNPASMADLEKNMVSRWRSTPRTSAQPKAASKTTVVSEPPVPAPKQGRVIRPPKAEPDFNTNGATVKTQNPPQKPGVAHDKTVRAPKSDPRDAEITQIKTPQGVQKISVGELKKRIAAAFKWMTDEARKLSEKSEGTGAYRSPQSFWKELGKEAQKKFNLPEGWELL